MQRDRSPAACSLDAAAFVERRAHIRRTLAGEVLESAPIRGGWALRFERRDAVIGGLAELVGLEAVCCPFLRLRLDVEPAGGSVWLHVSGEGGLPSWVEAALRPEPGSGPAPGR